MLKCKVVLLICLTLASLVSSPPRNPIITSPVRSTWACVLWHESRSTISHPNLKDNNSDGGSSGVFQIIASTWDYWAPKVGIHVQVWRASYYQQSVVAVEIWRHDGFKPWGSDGCFG